MTYSWEFVMTRLWSGTSTNRDALVHHTSRHFRHFTQFPSFSDISDHFSPFFLITGNVLIYYEATLSNPGASLILSG